MHFSSHRKGRYMLLSEHVRDLALIREAEIDFKKGLNIITGETGAGKSLVIGSVALALGGKASTGMIRKGAEEALMELVFCVSEEEKEKLASFDITIEDDDLVIMSRKIKDGRTVARINGEAVNAAVLKKAASALIDIHGQRDQIGLLSKRNLLTLLDRFAGEDIKEALDKVSGIYREYREVAEEIENDISDPSEIARKKDLLSYEIKEIEEAALKDGEDTELEDSYRIMKNAKKIADNLSEARNAVAGEGQTSAAALIGRASESLSYIQGIDESTDAIIKEVREIEALIGDLSMDMEQRLENLDFPEKDFIDTENRLDLINRLKAKYGKTIEDIRDALEERVIEKEKLDHHDDRMEELKKREAGLRASLIEASKALSSIRRKAANRLECLMTEGLSDLNFEDVRFTIDITSSEEELSAKGYDSVDFLICLNKGEDLMPMEDVASGGELSRIMLALKTILADSYEIGTLIFDEIDTGISGRTAEKVAEKLALLSKKRQVIAITHLPQIAAMADHHFVIEKNSDEGSTQTIVREIKDDECVEELGRLLSGAVITDAVRENAKEMRNLAKKYKSS